MSARVLVVDDVLPNLKLLERKLTDEYFDVLLAQSGAEAIELARREQPDLILLDVMMPEMDGFEACQLLKADPRTLHIPVVMVTALDNAHDRVRGLEAGADDFLVKPVRDIELYARVRSLVRLKTVLDELRSRALTGIELGLTTEPDPERASPATIALFGEPGGVLDSLAADLDGFGSTISKSLTEAVAHANRLRSLDCDLVMVDLTAQATDGLRLVSRIRSFAETRFLPVLTVVDGTDLGPVVKGFELGASDCVKLPIDSPELQARLRTLIKRKRLADRLRETVHISMQLAVTDSVTGLYNRHYMTSHMTTLVRRARQTDRPLTLAILDIDHFKAVNDRFGHATGDIVLHEVAQRISLNIRGVDLAARYGGEEFVVLMPDTGLETARGIVDRLRCVVESTPFAATDGTPVPVTVSIGLAELAMTDADGHAVLARADRALYRAKGAGRNRIVVCPLHEQAA